MEEITAQTTNYMIAGFAVIISMIGGLIVSMFLRARSLRRDLQMLESLRQE